MLQDGNKARGGRDGRTDGYVGIVGLGLLMCRCSPLGGEKNRRNLEQSVLVCLLHPRWGFGVFRGACRSARGCQELGQPNAESAVLACSPGFSTVENHWDTGSPLPNSSVCDVSGMIFALLPFSGMETEGSGEFALLSCPLALRPLTSSERRLLCWQELVELQRG